MFVGGLRVFVFANNSIKEHSEGDKLITILIINIERQCKHSGYCSRDKQTQDGTQRKLSEKEWTSFEERKRTLRRRYLIGLRRHSV